MFLFHIEDENGLNPVARSYGKLEPIEIPLDKIDNHIADEIGAEVNGKKSRQIFSCSKSLGIGLFKYNFLTDNPLHIISLDREQILNTVLYKKRIQISIKLSTMILPVSIIPENESHPKAEHPLYC